MLKLYDYYRSSASFRVRIALNLKNLPFEAASIHLVNNGGEQHSNEYQQINPQSLVPSLQNEDKIITQSLAIIEYLEDLHPTPSLFPSDPFLKAITRSLALSIVADIHPLNNLRVLKYLTQDLNLSEDKKNTWYQHWIQKGLSALEKQLTKLNMSGDFCLGNSPTLADICLAPQMYNARRFACDTSDYPLLNRIDTHCQHHPAFIKAWPKDSE